MENLLRIGKLKARAADILALPEPRAGLIKIVGAAFEESLGRLQV